MDDAVIRPLSNPRAATAGITARPAPGNPLAAAVMWHFKEIAGAICQEPAPVDLVLLRVVLRGMAEVCGLLVERGGEAPVRPPSLFSDDRVVSEALGIWEGRLRFAMTEQGRAAATKHSNDGSRSVRETSGGRAGAPPGPRPGGPCQSN